MRVKKGSPLYNRLLAQGAIKKHSKYGVDTSAAGKAARTLDGILFGSISEKNRYAVLKQNERAGIITDLDCIP